MKKWTYVIFPLAALIVFCFIYFAHLKTAEEQQRVQQQQIAQQQAEEAAHKAEIEAKAQEDAARQAAQRAAAAAAKDAQDAAKWAAQGVQVRQQTDQIKAEADKLSNKVSDLTVALDKLHQDKAQAKAERLAAQKKVELARIARRDAELEIQRMVAMVVTKARQSTLTHPLIIPPAQK